MNNKDRLEARRAKAKRQKLISTLIWSGLGIVWFVFPYLDDFFTSTAATIKAKFQRAELNL